MFSRSFHIRSCCYPCHSFTRWGRRTRRNTASQTKSSRKICHYDGSLSRASAWFKRQCGCREFNMFMLIACWWLGGPPRKLSWGLVAAAMAAKSGGAPPPPNSAKEGGKRGRADNRSFSISASWRRFALARRFWNQIFTWKEKRLRYWNSIILHHVRSHLFFV